MRKMRVDDPDPVVETLPNYLVTMRVCAYELKHLLDTLELSGYSNAAQVAAAYGLLNGWLLAVRRAELRLEEAKEGEGDHLIR